MGGIEKQSKEEELDSLADSDQLLRIPGILRKDNVYVDCRQMNVSGFHGLMNSIN